MRTPGWDEKVFSFVGLFSASALALIGCGNTPNPPAADATVTVDAAIVPSPYVEIAAETQRAGDPVAGYHALVNNGYVNCGIPWSLYSQFFGGGVPAAQRIPGRVGRNDQLPYNMTASRTGTGVEIVSANCLSCHAGQINGELVIGLGDSAGDYTGDFYSAAGRGDHARIMMSASTLCTDTRAEADAINEYFDDVAAYIRSIEPPAYPWPVDAQVAEQGRAVFNQKCAECHGTYGPDGRYPNLLIPIGLVETDGVLANGGSQFAEVYVNWFNSSFYGETARLQPQNGYVAPPLDGIWATAPFLHNGSVPTIAALLDSSTRPRFFRRSFNSTDYNQAALGWNFEVVDHGQADEPNVNQKKYIYDTTQFGYGNGGHTFGDMLTPAERTAVIEYLKTL